MLGRSQIYNKKCSSCRTNQVQHDYIQTDSDATERLLQEGMDVENKD